MVLRHPGFCPGAAAATAWCPDGDADRFALATGFTGVLVGTAAATAVNRHDLAQRVAVVATCVALATALIAAPAGAACTAGMGWLFTNGFLVNGEGDLAWRGVADLARLAVFAAAALAGLGVSRGWQRRKSRAPATAQAEDVAAALREPRRDTDTTSALRLLPGPRGPAYLRPAGPNKTERRRNG
ncbi:MAG: hypothetical protein ACXV3F_00940 [Frankiaceae bacterium]